jgi:hypothetical protein
MKDLPIINPNNIDPATYDRDMAATENPYYS